MIQNLLVVMFWLALLVVMLGWPLRVYRRVIAGCKERLASCTCRECKAQWVRQVLVHRECLSRKVYVVQEPYGPESMACPSCSGSGYGTGGGDGGFVSSGSSSGGVVNVPDGGGFKDVDMKMQGSAPRYHTPKVSRCWRCGGSGEIGLVQKTRPVRKVEETWEYTYRCGECQALSKRPTPSIVDDPEPLRRKNRLDRRLRLTPLGILIGSCVIAVALSAYHHGLPVWTNWERLPDDTRAKAVVLGVALRRIVTATLVMGLIGGALAILTSLIVTGMEAVFHRVCGPLQTALVGGLVLVGMHLAFFTFARPDSLQTASEVAMAYGGSFLAGALACVIPRAFSRDLPDMTAG
ncbi:MAG: hypothetical protein IPK69_03610 [Phycisphaerales bacterium]|nr:MAG: hypothetical protein IPK69_03610 [Phycisphaerales bacterium]